ncbi:MAG TPA: DNA gyrase/topoisomerase IV subunit A, partial [Flavobacterium sp.]|nr:DNA gyrase/topoisomerase IV subunit A [Flavobacterium sp.]
GKERQTELRSFDTIEATKVVLRNTKLYVNKEEGFIGTGLKKDEYVADCSDIDDVIVFLRDGRLVITKVDEKKFIGKDIIHIAVFDKNDKRTIYNVIYRDGKNGASFIKRFNVSGITRDKEYLITQEKPNSEILYFSANPNGEAETVTILLRQLGNVKKLKWDLDFSDIIIKGRNSKGNTVTKYLIKKIELKERGISTLRPRKVWFDETVKRLNVDGRGSLLGEFKPDDRLLIINQSGKVKTIIPDLSTHFEDDMIVLEKWNPNKPISAIYFDGEKERYYVKRFLIENENKEELFISEHEKSQLELVSTDWKPVVEIIFAKVKGEQKEAITINIEEFIMVKGIKALGNQLTTSKIKEVNALEPLPYEEFDETIENEFDVKSEEIQPTDIKTDLEEDGQITLSLE